ncbi:lipoprotein-releasing system permease protein [Desulfacinum hydrothermale DSM 13146]|uniref:Lipoprotein-releasing system permease protein n=1 Tax=Desulfacinum hydrothermale DSM 13146 TaxID=1121390 RepID=A0A1W1XV23_9BACT|nr:lipoprotein-releasing ABC transporter permease subunit [Desulfacinum hydrothermale]SMC27809.1 lipoprotein-releasing system permease protein [Desulfacinum hydrothermale DSM 13146]
MNFELFVSLRYLLAKRRQAFISLITVISVAGVAVGVMALIVVLAVMNGFQQDLRDRILGVTSHAVIGHFQGNFSDYRKVVEQVEEEDGVVAATPFVLTQVMMSSGRSVAGAILRGVDPASAGRVTRIEENLQNGPLASALAPAQGHDTPGIVLGVELAARLGVQKGDYVTLISPAGRLTPVGRVPKSRLFQVTGFFKSGMYEYDNSLAYVHLREAQKLLGIGETATGVELRVRDIYQAGAIAERLQKRLGYPFWVRDWMQMNHNLFSALKLEKTVMFIILTLIILVAAFNIVSSLIMMVMEKTKDIAILKAMGATTTHIRRIFVYEGLLIGVVGTTLGLLGGFALCGLLKRYQFIELPRDVYYISTLPVRLETLDVILIACAAIAICLLATFYPSRQAAKLQPAEALRYE